MESAPSEFRFGAARLDITRRQLHIGEKPAKLGARAFDVLLALVERRDRAVNKNELFELVWPDVVVEENNLQVHISTLRKLLGPQAITTIPGRGYRFTAGLDATESSAPSVVVPAATVPPVTPAVAAAPTNLSADQQPLYGRANDASAIGELLRFHAQVSIIGAGGIGKTRLALAVANAQREHFPDGVWWVELAALSDGVRVAGAIAQALGVRAGDERPVLETVVALLRNQTALLVLDNCEHLLDAAAECVRVLLRNAPGLRVLVTSQEALHTPEEQVYRLGSLPVTSDSASDAPAPAVELFVARAQAADPRLQLSTTGLATVAEICSRLDGIPLAIELAAARVRLLGIEGLRARLDERFHILTGGTRSVLRRHQTLRAALEWSYGLLSPDEQYGVPPARRVRRRFHTRTGAGRCCRRPDRPLGGAGCAWSPGGQVTRRSPTAKSCRATGCSKPCALLRWRQLAAAGETPTLLRRHAEALLAFLLPLDDLRWTTKTTDQIRTGAELDNLRAALTWAESKDGDRTHAYALIGASRRIWFASNQLNEGIERACRLLPLPDGITTEMDARFHLALGYLGYLRGRRECFVAAMRAAELLRALGDTSRLIDALMAIAFVGTRCGETQQAAAAIAEAESLIGPSTPPKQTAVFALATSIHFVYAGEYEKAVGCVLRQAAICREMGDEWQAQLALSGAAFYECGLGRVDAAIAKLRDAIATMRRLNVPYGIGNSQAFIACAHALRGDRDEALTNGRAAVPHLQRVGTVAWILPFIALVHAQQGSPQKAVCLVGYFDAEWAGERQSYAPFIIQTRDKVIALAHATLGAEEIRRHAAAGGALTEGQAIALAFDSSDANN